MRQMKLRHKAESRKIELQLFPVCFNCCSVVATRGQGVPGPSIIFGILEFSFFMQTNGLIDIYIIAGLEKLY